MRLVLLLVGSLVLTACTGSQVVEQSTAEGDVADHGVEATPSTSPAEARVEQLAAGVWRHLPPQDQVDTMDAEVIGILRFDEQCGARLETSDDGRYRILWPAGTEVTSTHPLAIALEDGRTARPGDRLRGGGGFVPVPDLEQYAGDCTHVRQVAVFNAADRIGVEQTTTSGAD